jgi:zinc/manganese transport system permease protein
MSLDLYGFDPCLLLAPFVAGLLVLATHVPLGIEVLRRGIIFIDLAVAQVAALGAVAASLVDLDAAMHDLLPHGLAAQLAAGLAAVVGALLLTWSERRWPEMQEALIGLVFVFAAAASGWFSSSPPPPESCCWRITRMAASTCATCSRASCSG